MRQTLKTKQFGIILAWLVLLGQIVTVVHAHDTEQHPEHSPCEICLHAQVNNDVLPVLACAFDPQFFVDAVDITVNQLGLKTNLFYLFQSRAPPTIS